MIGSFGNIVCIVCLFFVVLSITVRILTRLIIFIDLIVVQLGNTPFHMSSVSLNMAVGIR